MDKQQKASDLKVMIQHIDAMLTLTKHSVNSVSSQLMAVATAIECISLANKLQFVFDRWQVYLPFKEASDVDFNFWVGHLSNLHKELNSIGISHPDQPYLLDFIPLLDQQGEADDAQDTKDPADGGEELKLYSQRYADAMMQTDVKEYVERIEEQLDRISMLSDDEEESWADLIDKKTMLYLRQQYTDYLRVLYTFRSQYSPKRFHEEVLPKAIGYLKTINNQPVMAYCLDMALSTLLDMMRQINKFLSQESYTIEQYQRLSLRLFYRHCREAELETQQEVSGWVGRWPVRYRRDRAMDKREEIKRSLQQRYGELSLEQYIDIERPLPLAEPEFGRFLYGNRYKLEIDDVKSIFTDFYRIQHLNRVIDPLAMEADINTFRLNDQRKQIYARLKGLVQQAYWLGDMTAERVQSAFAEILLPQKPTEYTELFWNLLTKRRFCETGFRSLKLTWLNLVGYFINRGVLKGGDETLCNYFFPKGSTEGEGNSNDRHHINKGGDHRAPNDFVELRKELDRILGLDEKKSSKK